MYANSRKNLQGISVYALVHCIINLFFFVNLANAEEKYFSTYLDSEDYQFRFHCGVCKPSSLIPFSQKATIVSAMCLHYTC